MNSKENKDKAYANGDAEGKKYGYGFFERLGDGNVTVIMGNDERELHEINIKGKLHGADERIREKVEASLRPSSKSESPSTPSEVQYEPSDRGSYDSDDESYYGAGPGVNWESYKWDSYKCSSSSSSGVGGWWLLIAVIIVGLIITGIASSIEKKHFVPSKPNYSSAARYYPQSSSVSVSTHPIGKQADSRNQYRSAQTNQGYNDAPGQEESRITQSDGGNVVKSDPLVTASAETVSATSETAAVENVDLSEADWPNLNELREAVESQSKEIDKALDILNRGGN